MKQLTIEDAKQIELEISDYIDTLCKKHNINYIINYGTLIGAVRHQGFIPWDDDIDICMLRSDVDKLTAALKDDPEYQITLVYDWFVKCRQVRFCSTNSLIPCFVDISIYDRAAENSKRANDQLRQLRIELMDFFDKNEREFSFWKDNPWMVHPHSGLSVQCGDVDLEAQRTVVSSAEIDLVQSVFDSFNEKAHDLGLLTDESRGDFAYAIDNVFDAPKRKIIWTATISFP